MPFLCENCKKGYMGDKCILLNGIEIVVCDHCFKKLKKERLYK